MCVSKWQVDWFLFFKSIQYQACYLALHCTQQPNHLATEHPSHPDAEDNTDWSAPMLQAARGPGSGGSWRNASMAFAPFCHMAVRPSLKWFSLALMKGRTLGSFLSLPSHIPGSPLTSEGWPRVFLYILTVMEEKQEGRETQKHFGSIIPLSLLSHGFNFRKRRLESQRTKCVDMAQEEENEACWMPKLKSSALWHMAAFHVMP